VINFVHSLGKARGRSVEELRVRCRQMLSAFAERHGWSSLSRLPEDNKFLARYKLNGFTTRLLSAEALLKHFRGRTSPRFFPAFTDPNSTKAELRCSFGPAGESVIKAARQIVAGRFKLLGLEDLDFGNPINWHLEPLSGTTAPFVHWSLIDYLDAAQTGDKKITWELNRHTYFVTLGKAYWYTGDEIYAQTFAEHVHAWTEGNPPKIGVNWASSLEVAFRAISWLWALHFFRDSPHLTPPLFLRMLKLLYVHGKHLETYMSTYFSPNTHLTGEALGLFYLGLLLPEFREANGWRAKGESILMGELERHVRADGVYFEQSSYYHRYTADFYMHFLILSRMNSEMYYNALLEQKLTALLDHLMYITRPDGTTPLFGDDDGGKLIILDERPLDDFRSILSTGAVLFGRPDYKYVAREATEETLWLLGKEGIEEFNRIQTSTPASTSCAFRESGYFVMRDGWRPNSNYMVIDCGPHGALQYGHAHADALAYEVAACGRTILVDPGTYTYTGSTEMRDYFRSTASHNTLTLDGESSSVPNGPFSWKYVALASPLQWLSRERFDFFEGSHDGYSRLPSPAEHKRSVFFLKNDYWIILDRIESCGLHIYGLHFHFAAGAKPTVETDHGIAFVSDRPADEAGLEVFAFGPGGTWTQETGWVSRCYRQRAEAPVFSFTGRAEASCDLTTFLLPRAAQQPRTRIVALKADRGSAFEIENESWRDVVLLGGGETVQAATVLSDFRLAWFRFSEDTKALEELVLIDGRNLAFAGQEIVKSFDPIKFLCARSQNAELRGESDATPLWRFLPSAPIRYISSF